MSDQGRYGSGSRERGRHDEDNWSRQEERGRSGESGRGSSSMFDYGSRSRDKDRDSGSERGGGWTSERENFSWSRNNDSERDDRRNERGAMGRGGSRGEEDRGYGRDDRSSGLPVDETSRLIASNKVEGTAVYGSDGRKLGSIYNFMVDKVSGKVEYAVMSYGGIMGMGQRYYPLPWRTLSYDTREGGYRIDLTEEDLRHAPSFDRESEPQFNDRYGERVHGWYGLNR